MYVPDPDNNVFSLCCALKSLKNKCVGHLGGTVGWASASQGRGIEPALGSMFCVEPA